MVLIVPVIGWIFFSFIVGFLGIGRKVGFFGAFFLSLLLSPLIGLIITLTSKRKSDVKRERQMLTAQQSQQQSLKTMANQNNKTSAIEELTKLKEMLDSGAINNEEFEKMKAKIIN